MWFYVLTVKLQNSFSPKTQENPSWLFNMSKPTEVRYVFVHALTGRPVEGLCA